MNLRGRHLRGVHLRSSFGWLLFLHLTSTVFGALFAEVQQIPLARVPIGTLKSDVEERSGATAVHYAVSWRRTLCPARSTRQGSRGVGLSANGKRLTAAFEQSRSASAEQKA